MGGGVTELPLVARVHAVTGERVPGLVTHAFMFTRVGNTSGDKLKRLIYEIIENVFNLIIDSSFQVF